MPGLTLRHPEIDALAREAYAIRYHDRERAGVLAATALVRSIELGYEFGRGQALLVRGALAFPTCGDGALEDALAALRILRDHDAGGGEGGEGTPGYDEARAHALCQNLLAVHHCVWGAYDTSIEHLRVVLEIATRIGDRAAEALANTNMAVANERTGDYEAAIGFHDAARRLAREAGDELRYWIATAYRAEALALAGRPEEALSEALLALGSPVLAGTPMACEAALSVAGIHSRRGDHAPGRAMLDEARRLCEAGDHRLVACAVEEVAGRLAAAERRDESAIAHFRLAIEISHRTENVANRATALRGIVDACRRLGRHGDALAALDEIVAMKETLRTEESAGRARALSVAHRLEWDRREAALVRAQNAELREANARLHALLSEKEALHERVRSQATLDELTGLPNRRATARAGEHEFERHRRSGGGLCVALLDVDRFKAINDTYGHAAGDEVLRRLADVLARETRLCDALGRWGGEEFLGVLSGLTLEEGVEAAERWRAAIATTAFGDLFPAGSVTVSVGVAEATGHAGFDALVRTADAALYGAKRDGRDRVRTALPTRRSTPEIARGVHAPALG